MNRSENDASALLAFTLQCQLALTLHNSKSIASLEDHTTVDAVVGRLDKVLRREWFTHLLTLPGHHAYMPTFRDFASWIQQKSHIARLDRSSRLDRDKYKTGTNQANTKTMPKSTATTPLTAGTQPATSFQRTQKFTPKAQKSTPGGDKQYLDTTRRRQSPPNTSTFQRNMPTNVSDSPRLSRNRDISPKTNNSWCA